MKEFQKNLSAIGNPIYKQPVDKEKAYDSDIEELPNPKQPDSKVVAKEVCTIPVSMVSADPHDLDEIVRDMMSIDDAKCLE